MPSLTPFSEGAAIGLLNVVLALATAVGIVFSGPLVGDSPIRSFPVTALAGLVAALLPGIKTWTQSQGALGAPFASREVNAHAWMSVSIGQVPVGIGG